MRSTAAITFPTRTSSRKTSVNVLVTRDVAAYRTEIDERGGMRARREIAAIIVDSEGVRLQLTSLDDAKSARASKRASR
jgi:hypothetical protein